MKGKWFDEIAEVICHNCDWFGMKNELRDGRCPECGSANVEREED